LATVTQGNLATEKGLSLTTEPALRKEDIPKLEECEDRVYPAYLEKIAPAALKLREKRLKGGIEGTGNAEKGRSVRETWFTFADGTGFDVLSLGYLTDKVRLFLSVLSNGNS
jgi:hypothetical protein